MLVEDDEPMQPCCDHHQLGYSGLARYGDAAHSVYDMLVGTLRHRRVLR